MLNIEQLHGIMPRCPSSFLGPLNSAMQEFGIVTPERMSAFLAQAAHESSECTRLEENLNYSAGALTRTWPKRFPPPVAVKYARKPKEIAERAYGGRMGNGPEGSGDGWKHRGYGVFQLTGKDAHIACGKALGIDLENKPELLLVPINACRSAGWYWRDYKKLHGIVDFLRLSQLINGSGFGTPNGYDERLRYYKKALEVLHA